MHADHASLTGLHHLQCASPCQDYAQSGLLREGAGAWGVLADGCSTGGHTDLGARAWVCGVRDWLLTDPPGQSWANASLMQAWQEHAQPYLATLSGADALATVGALHANAQRACVALWGDGVVVLKHLDGRVTTIEQRFTLNAPPYPQYWRDRATLLQYAQAYASQEVWRLTSEFSAEGDLLAETKKVSPLDLAHPVWVQSWQWQEQELAVVMLASDGALSRQDVPQTLNALADFKGLQGEFLKRRVARLYRQWSKDNTLVQDDLSVVAVTGPAPLSQERS